MRELNLESQTKMRSMLHEYRKLEDFDLEVIPYAAIERGLQYEIFFRKYNVGNWHTEFYNNRPGSVLYLFPQYVQRLYDVASRGLDYKYVFQDYEPIITQSFEYLFPRLIKTLNKVASSTGSGIFEETGFRRFK